MSISLKLDIGQIPLDRAINKGKDRAALLNRKKSELFKSDDLVKSPKSLFFVIPAKAGIQYFHRVTKILYPVFQRGDDFLRDRQK
jgi:hypothetical protein